jgi:hypothetical protein
LLLNPAQFHLHGLTEFLVETRERLVEQQHVGFGSERTREGDSLLLAPRELVWSPVCSLREFDQFEHLRDALVDCLAVLAPDFEAVGDVLGDSLVRKQCEVLEYHPDITLVGGDAVHPVAADADDTLGELFEARNRPECRRLSTATRPDERDELAFLDDERDVTDCLDTTGIGLRDSFEYDSRHLTPPG